MDVALWVWGALLVGILAMLAVDLFMHRDAHVIGVKEAAVWSLIWVAVAVGVVGATVVAGAGWVVATGPTSCIAGAGSSRSAPLPSLGMSIHRISPTSQRWTNGK